MHVASVQEKKSVDKIFTNSEQLVKLVKIGLFHASLCRLILFLISMIVLLLINVKILLHLELLPPLKCCRTFRKITPVKATLKFSPLTKRVIHYIHAYIQNYVHMHYLYKWAAMLTVKAMYLSISAL